MTVKRTSEWFYEPQKQIREELEKYTSYNHVSQIISPNREDVFEKYIVKTYDPTNNIDTVEVIMYHMEKVQYGSDYRVSRYKYHSGYSE